MKGDGWDFSVRLGLGKMDETGQWSGHRFSCLY